MNNRQFTPFPKTWVSNLSATIEIAFDDFLTNNALPHIRALVEFQNILNQYLTEGDNISAQTHNELLSTLSGGIVALSTAGIQFDDDQGVFDDNTTTQ